MEIKIDTERDSRQDIKKVIIFLQDLIGEGVSRFDNSSSSIINTSSPSSNQSSGFNRDLSFGSSAVNHSTNYSDNYSNLNNSSDFIKSPVSEPLRQESSSKDNYDVPSDGLFNIFSESSKKSDVGEKKFSMNDLMQEDSSDEDDEDDYTRRNHVDIIPY